MAKSTEESQAAPTVYAVLNPATHLGGYGFEDGFELVPRKRYPLSEEEYKEYSKDKHNGHQVLIKA